MAATLPQLPAKHQDLVSYVHDHPDTPIEQLIGPFNEYEAAVRKLFAQEPTNPLLQDNLLNIAPIYGPSGANVTTRARDVSSEPAELREKYITRLRDEDRRTNGSPAVVPTLEEFKNNFGIFSEGSLSDMEWDNVVVAGSAVVTSLLPVPEEYRSSKRALRQYYHDKFTPASDVDLFLYGLTEEQAIEKIRMIEDKIKNSILYETTTIRTKNTITIVSQYPTRHVQIVLRIYKSISEILTGFDVDCSCVAYDGKQVYASPRALASYATQVNRVDLSRRSPSYENRLSKYAHRGFEVFWPQLDRSRIDPTIFERSFSRTVGLARLLVLEKLPTSSDRESYSDQRRLERGRPARNQGYQRFKLSGNIKNDWEDETPEWEDGDEVSDYNTFTIPYGPKFYAKKIEKLLYKKDLLLNAEWNKSKSREVNLHRHPAFFGNLDDVIHDCCGDCPAPVTPEEKEVAEEESKHFISGAVTFIKDDPGRQEIGSFHPITETDWTEMAYVGNAERLCHAIVDEDIDAVKEWLSQESADPNDRDYTGRTPLHLACSSSTVEIVQCLVDHGARLTARLADGQTALHIAAARGSAEIVKILLTKSEENEAEEDKKAELKKSKAVETDQKDDEGNDDEEMKDDDSADDTSYTESFVKVEEQKEDGSEALPEDDSEEEPDIYDINVIAWDNRASPLHLAILHGHTNVVEELVSSFGADVLLPVKLLNSYDNSPRAAILTLVLALRLPLEEAKAMTETLLKLGASPTQADIEHNTPVQYLAATGYTDLIDTYFEQNKPATDKAISHIAFSGRSWSLRAYSPLMVALNAKDTIGAFQLLESGAQPEILFDHYLKSGRTASSGIRTNSEERNHEIFRNDLTQPVVLAVKTEQPGVVLNMLARGVDPNILTPQGYEVQGNEYARSSTHGKSLLDAVQDKLKELRGYKGEWVDSTPPIPLQSDDHYLKGLEEGSYKLWLGQQILKKERKRYDDDLKDLEKTLREAKDRKGVEKKMASVKRLIQEFEEVEKVLLAKHAKTFRQMFPNFERPDDERESQSPKPYKEEPFALSFKFRVAEDPETQSRYMKLFEAAWRGDIETIKTMTLGMWGPYDSQPPLQIAVSDSKSLSPFSIAVLRGHLKAAKVILEIAQAQYQPEDTKVQKRYNIDGDSDTEESDNDNDEISLYSEIVDDKFTIDDISGVATKVESKISPHQILSSNYPIGMFVDRSKTPDTKAGLTGPRDLLTYAVWTDNVPLLVFLLELGQTFTDREVDDDTTIYSVPDDLVYLAIDEGRLGCLEELISRTGADIPLDELVQTSGVESDEKPKFYQGLSIHGKKRADWAAGGRTHVVSTQKKSSPLLISAQRGSLKSTEWFLSTAPGRHYVNFTKAHEHDKRLKLLAQSSNGIEKSVMTWLNTRNELVLHCAILAGPTEESRSLVQYLAQQYPAYLTAKSDGGYTPLALAFSLHRASFAEILIRAGADQTTRDAKGNNLIHLTLVDIKNSACDELKNMEKLLDLIDPRLVSSMLTERSADGPGSLTPLARWMHFTDKYCRYYHDDDNRDRHLETNGRVDVLRCLLNFAKPTGQTHLGLLDGTGNTPVHEAVKQQLPTTFSLMLTHRPDLLHRENSTGTTPFELAVGAWVEEASSNPPRIPLTTTRYWNSDPDEVKNIVDKSPEFFTRDKTSQRKKSERKTICDLCRELASGAPQKRKLVSLNEANEVARRLFAQSEAKRRQTGRSFDEGEDEDEVVRMYHRVGYVAEKADNQ